MGGNQQKQRNVDARPHRQIFSAGWRALAVAATAALILTLGITAPAAQTAPLGQEKSVNPSSYAREVDQIQAELALWQAARAELEAAISEAQLAAEAAGTEWAQAELAELQAVVARDGLVCGDSQQMATAAADIRKRAQALNAQVAAEQAAAAEAQAQAEAEARARASNGDAWSAGDAESGGSYTLFVGGAAGAGEQWVIDACNGASDVTAWYGTPSIAQHWSCGGSSFPSWPGAQVTLTGRLDGVYEVLGVVAILDASIHTVADIPGGYDLIYQTCVGGSDANMSIIALRRIG